MTSLISPRFVVIVLACFLSANMEIVATKNGVAGNRRKRSDDTLPLEALVEQLSQRVSAHDAQITALTTKAVSASTTVAFHAWNSVQPLQALSQGILILNHATTNIGNGYDPRTGVFTAPVSGLYFFQATMMIYPVGVDSYLEGSIFVDDQQMARGISDSRHGLRDQCSMHVVTHVTAGQRVYVRNVEGKAIQLFVSLGEPYTTFSGFLVRPDQ